MVPVFGRFQCSVDGRSTASCNFGALAGGDERTSFYSAILNWGKKKLGHVSDSEVFE